MRSCAKKLSTRPSSPAHRAARSSMSSPQRRSASVRHSSRNSRRTSSSIVTNARVLADALQKQGFDLVSGGTDNHLMLIDLRKTGVTGKELQRRLDEVYITANKNAIPNDPESPFVTSRHAHRHARCHHPRLRCAGDAPHCRVHLAGRNRFRQQGKRYPPKCTRYLRKFSNLLTIFADSLLLESAFLLDLFGLHNAKLPVRNRRADKVFVRFEQNACLFPSVCYT